MTARRVIQAVVVAVIGVTLMAAAARAQGPVRFSVVGGMSLPLGDLANNSTIGLNLGLRGEGRSMPSGWSMRGDVSYDRYDGRGSVNEYSYLAVAGNLVHRGQTERLYEFGGLGVYNSRVAFTNTLDRSDTNLGVQMGLGYEMTADRRVFSEFGLTSAFTSGRSSLWFPLRIGIRF